MGVLKRIGDFVAPKDEASGSELKRQLRTFQDNVSDMGDRLKNVAMARLSVATRERRDSGLLLAPGEAAGIITKSGDIYLSLSKPTSSDQGKFVYLWSPNQLNHIFIAAAAGSTVNGVNQTVVNMATRFTILIFCDGSGYWVD